MATDPKRFLIVVFDALRPEFVTPELMPNLHGFAARGVRFANARSTFPTETRVNQSAVTTGCYPHRHGVVANRFPLPEAANDSLGRAVLNTGDDLAFEATIKRMPGRLIGVPTLGEILAGAGKRYASLSAGTSGGGRLINLMAEQTSGFRLALKRPEASIPTGVFAEIEGQLGPLPAYGTPALAWNSCAVNTYLDYIEPNVAPDVMLLWLCEPDESFHWHGIGSPASLEAIAHIDREFGRILARQQAPIAAGELQIVAMSDHGQISLAGAKLDLAARMVAAGFRAGPAPGEDTDYSVVVHNGGGIWVRGSDPALSRRLVLWLRDQPWCGPLFTKDAAVGTLAQAELRADHPRAADVVLALDHSDAANDWGRAGLSADNAPYPEGGGCHGGLSRHELENFIALGGSAFREHAVLQAPAANVDVLPTVLAMLGVPLTHAIDGRVLDEALPDGGADAAPSETVLSSTNAGRQSHLSVTDHRGHRYLNRSWADPL